MPMYFNSQDDNHTQLNEYKNIPSTFEKFFYMCTGDYKFKGTEHLFLRILSFPSRFICKVIVFFKNLF